MSWYFDEGEGSYYSKPRPIIKHCPVCKRIFKFDPSEVTLKGYCEECDTDFYFARGEEKPTKNECFAIKPKTCNCLACQGPTEVEETPLVD